MRLSRAIVRLPAANFAAGISSSIGGGAPDVSVALLQHQQYCRALRGLGLQLTELAPDARFPDSTFVEDTAVLAADTAIITRPGAVSRAGETVGARESLERFFGTVLTIQSPGTLDGGDVCEVEGNFIIGLSGRTNEEGARQLSAILYDLGRKSTVVDIRDSLALLHLKTGLSYLADGIFVAISDARLHCALLGYEIITVATAEAYAANCIFVNGRVLIAAGYPKLRTTLKERGYHVVTTEMSEFRKMDGGLSCLSLRF